MKKTYAIFYSLNYEKEIELFLVYRNKFLYEGLSYEKKLFYKKVRNLRYVISEIVKEGECKIIKLNNEEIENILNRDLIWNFLKNNFPESFI